MTLPGMMTLQLTPCLATDLAVSRIRCSMPALPCRSKSETQAARTLCMRGPSPAVGASSGRISGDSLTQGLAGWHRQWVSSGALLMLLTLCTPHNCCKKLGSGACLIYLIDLFLM